VYNAVAVYDALDSYGPSPSRRCVHCGAGHGRLVAEARFCPSCGKPIEIVPAAAAPRFSEFFSSLVLRGYANAMFRLGVRYEFRHNDDEAIRCYSKASRLGSETAYHRLSEIPLAAITAGDDEEPPSAEHGGGTTVA
jgi:TPR repeat protein